MLWNSLILLGKDGLGFINTSFVLETPDNKIGRASSEQAIKAATTVPIVMWDLIYISAAITLIPHWGIIPVEAPIRGDSLFSLEIFLDLAILSSIKLNSIYITIMH